MEKMKPSELVVWQVLVLILFTSLFTLSTTFLRSATCFEGGTVLGFPWVFYHQCYGPLILGDGQGVDAPAFFPVTLALDLAVWYLVSVGLVFLFRRAIRLLVSRPSREESC